MQSAPIQAIENSSAVGVNDFVILFPFSWRRGYRNIGSEVFLRWKSVQSKKRAT